MRISILSMQEVNNYGSVLQAYALKKMLEKFGCEVSFTGVKIVDKEYEKYRDSYIHIYEQNHKVTGYRRYLTLDRYFFNRINHKVLSLSKKEEDIFHKFRKEYLGIEIGEIDNKFDACVIGSDEVFNCLSERRGYVSQLFGNIDNVKKIFSYAASCGFSSIDRVPDEMRSEISLNLNKLSGISVRDENTRSFIKAITGIDVPVHLDPVLIYDFQDELAKEAEKVLLPHRYCLVYAYGGRISNTQEIKKITGICKDNNMKLVTLGGAQDWVYKHLTVSPFTAMKLFKNASFVITDTFHGTIMSYKYAKKFAVLLRESNTNKLYDLTKRIDVEKHIVTKENTIDRIFKMNNDIKKNNIFLAEQREKTLKYLEENLNEN